MVLDLLMHMYTCSSTSLIPRPSTGGRPGYEASSSTCSSVVVLVTTCTCIYINHTNIEIHVHTCTAHWVTI